MGHTKIGRIPKSKTWESIIEFLNSEGGQYFSNEEISIIANESLLAAEKGLLEAYNDTGVYNSIFIVAKIFESIAINHTLSEYYIDINKISNSREFAFEIHKKLRAFFIEHCISSDKSEIALKSISRAIIDVASQKQLSLISELDTKAYLKKIASKNGFAEFAQKFIANFTYFYTNFFLSRISNYSTGNDRLKNINHISSFNIENLRHWNESSYIVRDLSGVWFAKKVFFEKNLTLQSVKTYLSLSFRKMSAEAKTQRGKS
jgi:hypothetical protein